MRRGNGNPLCRSRESGVTIIELMISMLVLIVGVVGIAQLYAVATLNGALSVNTSTGIIDAHRCLEAMRGIARSSSLGVNDPRLVSATYDTTLAKCPTYVSVTGYDSQRFRESVWVFNNTGRVDGNGIDSPGSTARGSFYSVESALPRGFSRTPLAPAANTLTVIVQLDPIVADPRFVQSVVIMTVISHEY
jgi:hypothetical protein